MPFCVIILCPHGGAVIMERICAKDHGGLKCPSVVPFEILHSEGPFEVASFEHIGLERPFNMAAMIFFTIDLYRFPIRPFQAHRRVRHLGMVNLMSFTILWVHRPSAVQDYGIFEYSLVTMVNDVKLTITIWRTTYV